jgi:hypothetical protein
MTDLNSQTHLRAAAWVPDDDPHRPWEEAADLAAGWLWERSEIEGVKPCLVTNVQGAGMDISSLADIAGVGGCASPRSRSTFDRGPVLAYVPGAQSLHLAMELARGYSLVAVEGSSFSLSEWAAGSDAINLVTGDTSTSTIPAGARDDLDSAIFYGGSNGWTAPDEKTHARQRLADHVRAGRLSPDAAASYAMSQGVSDRGAKRLRKLLERAEVSGVGSRR